VGWWGGRIYYWNRRFYLRPHWLLDDFEGSAILHWLMLISFGEEEFWEVVFTAGIGDFISGRTSSLMILRDQPSFTGSWIDH